MPIKNFVSKPKGEAIVHKDANGLNKDIRAALEEDFPKAVAQFRGIEKILKGKTERESAELIWLFLKKYCTYRRDKDSHQLIRTPSYFLHHSPHLGDCKTFALFARSAFAHMYPNNETAFKFTSYSPNPANPTHVYTIVKDRNRREIIIDGCWRSFDSEKKSTLALPLNFKTMRITSLAGTSYSPSELLNGINDRASAETRDRIKKLCALRSKMNLARAEFDGGHINREEFRNKISEVEGAMQGINAKSKEERKKKLKEGGKKFLWGIAFIHLAPIRGAFTSIVAMNVNGLAHNLKFVYDNREAKTKTEWKKIESIWQKVGGLKKALLKAIQLGAKHKPLFLSKKRKAKFEARHKGIKGIFVGEGDGINIAPAVAAAALAAATGIIAAIIPPVMAALKNSGKNQAAQEVAEQGEELVQKNTTGELRKETEQAAEQELEGEGMSDYIGNAETWGNLASALGEVAKVGITAAGTAIAKKVKKNPKAKKFLDKVGEGADDYFTGRYLRESGYKKTAQEFGSAFTTKNLLIGGGILAAVLGFVVLKKK